MALKGAAAIFGHTRARRLVHDQVNKDDYRHTTINHRAGIRAAGRVTRELD